MWRLRASVMNYDWGSTSAIPRFVGSPAGDEPVAEMWFGAHPKAPSVLEDFEGNDAALDEVVVGHPELLGEEAVSRFGRRLPYLVKLLAAGKPLSLQVHPDEGTAGRGHEREEAAGVAMDDPERTYKDAHHKPEAMIALAPTETLSGFRDRNDARALLEQLDVPWAARIVELLDDRDMRPAFEAMIDSTAWESSHDTVLARCQELSPRNRAYELVGVLDEHFPGDSGAAAPLLLNDVQYGPGEALFVPTREIHAHVGGFGVEVMAASDNVIRAGLTSKYVDRAALFQVIEPRSTSPQIIDVSSGGRLVVPVSEFRVQVLGQGDAVHGRGPTIGLAVDETGAEIEHLELARGEAVFIPDGEQPTVGRGVVWLVGIAA